MLLHFDLHKHGEVLVVCMQIEPIQPSQQRRHLLLNLLLALRISCNYASKSLLLLHSHLNEPHSHHAVVNVVIVVVQRAALLVIAISVLTRMFRG